MSSPGGFVDLRSDTVTTPTPEMRAAMASAEVGDDGYREDPTVNRLESLAAALLGKEAAVFTPSGTMANQLALRVLGRPGSEFLCADRAHVYRYENAASSVNTGMQARRLPDGDGFLSPRDIAAAIEDQHHHLPSISMIAIENTHMAASGRPSRVVEVDAVADIARANGLALHCDGARIWNAAVALEVSPVQLVDRADTVMFCLSKGLGAPIGSLLCGSGDVVAEARLERARFGGRMRQGGIVAAAGIVALETMVDRLAADHERARRFADALDDRFPGSVSDAVETNIVCAARDRLPDEVVERLAEHGVRCGTIDSGTIRFVTHKDVDDADLERAIAALDAIAAE